MYSEDTYQSEPEGDDWMFSITVSKSSEVEKDFVSPIVKLKGSIQ